MQISKEHTLEPERHISEDKPEASNCTDLFNTFHVGEDLSLWLWLNAPQLNHLQSSQTSDMQEDYSSVALIWKWKRRIFCNCVSLSPSGELPQEPTALSCTVSPLATRFLATRIPCDRYLGLHTPHICTHTTKFSFTLSGKELWAGRRTAMQLTILSFNASSFFHVILA